MSTNSARRAYAGNPSTHKFRIGLAVADRDDTEIAELSGRTNTSASHKSQVTSKQENNEEQAHGRQRDERAWLTKITAIFL
jgi:hypothetical protein